MNITVLTAFCRLLFRKVDNIFLNLELGQITIKPTFFSCFIPRYIRTLTFDIILSTAFGVQSECQTNPDDPTMIQARDALRFGPVALTVIALGLLLPYGTKLLKLLSPWLFKNFQGIKNVADQVIRTSKEKGEGTEKVSLCKY